MRFFKIEFDSDIKRYEKWRRLGVELCHKIIEETPKDVLLESANDFCILMKDKTMVFDSEDETHYLMDRIVYDIERQGKRYIEIYIDKYLESLTNNEKRLLNAMKNSSYSLFKVVGLECGKGLHLLDVFFNKRLFLIDINLSQTAEIGCLVASRIISIDNINFTSGCVCAFDGAHLKQLKDNFITLYEKKKHTMTWQEMMRRYNPYFFKLMKQRGKDIHFSDLV